MSSPKSRSQTDIETAAMNGLDSQLRNLPPGPMRDEILRIVSTVGVRKALFAAFDLLEDKNTPAAARATTINTIFRIAGLLDRPEPNDDPFTRISAEELGRMLPLLSAEAKRLETEMAERQKLIDSFDEHENRVDVFA